MNLGKHNVIYWKRGYELNKRPVSVQNNGLRISQETCCLETGRNYSKYKHNDLPRVWANFHQFPLDILHNTHVHALILVQCTDCKQHSYLPSWALFLSSFPFLILWITVDHSSPPLSTSSLHFIYSFNRSVFGLPLPYLSLRLQWIDLTIARVNATATFYFLSTDIHSFSTSFRNRLHVAGQKCHL
jgi:hypothetical protein